MIFYENHADANDENFKFNLKAEGIFHLLELNEYSKNDNDKDQYNQVFPEIQAESRLYRVLSVVGF